MFCVNCGKQIGDGQVMCEACAAAKNLPYNPNNEPGYQPQQPAYEPPGYQPQQPAYEPPVYQPQQPVYQQPVYQQPAAPEQPFVLNNPAQEQPKKAPKKKKGGKGGKGFPVGGLVAAVLVVAIAVTAVFCWDAISSFFVRSFASPEDYMAHVEQKAAKDQINSLTSAYGGMLDALGGGAGDYAMQTEMHFEMGDELLTMLETTLAYSGMDMDLSWLSDIKMTIYGNYSGDLTQSDIGIGLGKTTIATISVLLDMESGDLYMGIPELSDTYLSGSMEDAGMTAEDMAAVKDTINELMEKLPSEEKLNENLTRYWDIVLANAQDVEKGTETVEVDGLEQKLNVISCTFTEEDLLNIAAAILEDVRDDEEMMDLIVAVYELSAPRNESSVEGVYDPETDSYYSENITVEVDYEAEVKEAIAYALEELETLKDDADDDNRINLTTYIDNADKIVGRTIEVEADGDTSGEIYYITVWEKDAFAFEANFNDMAEIVGSGEREKNLVSGEYELTVEGEDILTLEVENYDEKLAEDGYINGSFTIEPSDALMEQMMGGGDLSGMGGFLDFAKLSLQFDITSSESGAEYAVRAKMAGATLIGVTISSTKQEATKVKVPSDTVDMYDEEAMMDWAMNLDYDQLIENLEDAGVADMIVDAIMGGLDSMFSDDYYDDYYEYPDYY